MTVDERSCHLLAVGRTGTGKSKFLEHLVRQDILAWPRSGCGMLVMDLHGSLFDGLTTWCAAKDLHRWPIVPIDLRRTDICVSINLIRNQPAHDPAVLVNRFVRAILHGWGQSNSNETPRLAKWLRTFLLTLYQNGVTIYEALALIHSPEIRRRMADKVEDALARAVWESSRRLKEEAFQTEVESTMNRLIKFLSSRIMRAVLSQSEVSLDLARAIREGHIVLVSLATNAKPDEESGEAPLIVDEEDAAALGALLVSELWAAAKSLGKKNAARGRPFYAYIDEFQEFVTPAMTKTLDQARGFGLHMSFGHQYPSQVLLQGDQGRALYASMMVNCKTKVVFQTEHPEDLPLLAESLFRHHVDTDQIKYQGWSTKVLSHELQYLPSYGTTVTNTNGQTATQSHGVNKSVTDSETHTEGSSTSETTGTSVSVTIGGSRALSIAVDDDGNQFVTESDSDGDSTAEADMDSTTESQSESHTTGHVETAGTSDAQGQSIHHSHAIGNTTTNSPMLMPIMGNEAQSPIFRSVDEQLFRFGQYLSAQPDRHCVVRLAGSPQAICMVTAHVAEPMTTPEWTDMWTVEMLQKLDFATPIEDALKSIEARERKLLCHDWDEPSDDGRPLT
jgi:hypothetical protein